ncbi:MAG: class II aldolase/adducin family protein [Rhodospirillaceae bacterium]|nr:class II aldolase/adducin family protein [Rhodospirillaceae bacterium]
MKSRPTHPRRAVIETAIRLVREGLNRGSAGNVSLRAPGGFLVTPSGMEPDMMRARDIVFMDMNGVPSGARNPSSEWRMHRDIYAHRPEIGGIVHCHAPFSVALAVLRRAIPAYHYMVAKAGGRDIRCAGYATYGTQALSDQALAALENRRACLLANHGMLALGATLDEAFALAVEVEELAEGYWRALQLGAPVLLADDEMDRVLEKFAHYGRAAQEF